MIIKSMSRKEASFSQLMDYIDRDGEEEAYRIRHNLAGRDFERIREELERNAELMLNRKNGVFMYHEIISITRAKHLELEKQKERLHQIAQEYIAMRSPRNICYGGLHDDKDHSLHYHLLISSNEVGESRKHRLSKSQFREIQNSLEHHVLRDYPELEQKPAIDKRAERKQSRNESEMRKRGRKPSQKEAVKNRVEQALNNSQDKEVLLENLRASNFELYVRGKNLGVIDHETGKKHRLRTLAPELQEQIETRMEQKQQRETTQKPQEAHRETKQEKDSRYQKHSKPSPEASKTAHERTSQAREEEIQGDRVREEEQPQSAKESKASSKERNSAYEKENISLEVGGKLELSPMQQRWKEQADRQQAEEQEQKR